MRKLIIILLLLTSPLFAQKNTDKWFPKYQFEASKFLSAPREYGPFTRWWWPGNDVTNNELQREIKILAENGFAGVEIQPLTMGINMGGPKEITDRIYSWDTPSFYEHLKAVMEQAQTSKITVDMNGGSGWPLGGQFFAPQESMRTLGIADSALVAGTVFNGRIPLMKIKKATSFGAQENEVKPEWGILQSLVAAKIIKQEGKQVILDKQSIINLTNKVKDNQLTWQVPADGQWRLIASWSIPSGEQPSLVAKRGVNYVIDHLDPQVVNKAYDYLLGTRTGLEKYYGNPLRAIFNDSYEFHTSRIISPDFLEVFKQQNGYDIAPYLVSVFKKGYNHPVYLAAPYYGELSPYVVDPENQWRLTYDYDRAVNKVFTENFIKTSNNWMQKRGMLHRTQAYGFPIEPIGSAGSADLPETEQLFADGSEGALKLATSGAHLYNKPIISQESFVAINRAEMTTPQKIKVWADKSLACGVNHFIYHGTPYKYNNGEFPKEGWNTWSSPFLPMVGFSSSINESDPFWNDIKSVNQYLTRCQYALRAGKPQYDVLIYFPFVNFSEDQIEVNPEETLIGGYFEGVEPKLGSATPIRKTVIYEWYKNFWKTVNELEAKGITWEFVNDNALQTAKFEQGKWTINGNQYQVLALSHLPYINLKTAQHIKSLNEAGANIWAIGEMPTKQPSYLDYTKNDAITKALVSEIWTSKHTHKIETNLPTGTIVQKIRYVEKTGWSRQINRVMADGSMVKFISNKSKEWQTIRLTVDKSLSNHYWFNAENGKAIKAKGNTVSYRLSPYGSIFLVSSPKLMRFTEGEIVTDEGKEIAQLDNWNIKIGENTFDNSKLFDWRTNEKTKYSSEKGIYTTSFNFDGVEKGKKYFLDLGEVYYKASVKINGIEAGEKLFAPYKLAITPLLKKGNNMIEITITTTRRNGFIGEAVKGNKQYLQFRFKEKTIVPSGLVGSVSIIAL